MRNKCIACEAKNSKRACDAFVMKFVRINEMNVKFEISVAREFKSLCKDEIQ